MTLLDSMILILWWHVCGWLCKLAAYAMLGVAAGELAKKGGKKSAKKATMGL